MTIGIVLGGAGTRGGFQVGAARLLRERGVSPNVISGTSGGAVVALKLAEGGDAVSEAEQLLRSLKNAGSIYRRRPWVAELDDDVDSVQRIASFVESNALGLLVLGIPLIPHLALGVPPTPVLPAAAIALGITVGKTVGAVKNERSLYEQGPLAKLLAENVDLDKVRASGIKLRIGVVGVESGRLRFVTENGGWSDSPDGAVRPAECDGFAARIDELPELIRGLRIAVDMLDSRRDRRQIDKLNRQIDAATIELEATMREAESLGCSNAPIRIGLYSAVLASGAMPGFFPPVRLGDEDYVDGGLRSLLPLQAAVDAGADTIYAIYPKPDLSRVAITGQLLIAAYLSRSIDLMLEQIRRLETSVVRSLPEVQKLVEIQASVAVHSELMVDPGLTSISIDYGYMRASDVIDGRASGQEEILRAISDAIVRLRMACWKLEYYVTGITGVGGGVLDDPSLPPLQVSAGDSSFLQPLRARKWLISVLVARRIALGGAVPSESNEWSNAWEQHDWEPSTLSPWAAFKNVSASSIAEFGVGPVLLREYSSAKPLLVRNGERFDPGDASIPGVPIVVEDGTLNFVPAGTVLPPPPPPPPPPLRCVEIRNELEQLELTRERLLTVLDDLDPRREGPKIKAINKQLADADARTGELIVEAAGLGCAG